MQAFFVAPFHRLIGKLIRSETEHFCFGMKYLENFLFGFPVFQKPAHVIREDVKHKTKTKTKEERK